MLRIDPNYGVASFGEHRSVLLADQLKFKFYPGPAEGEARHSDEKPIEQPAFIGKVNVGVLRDQAKTLLQVCFNVRQHLFQRGVPALPHQGKVV